MDRISVDTFHMIGLNDRGARELASHAIGRTYQSSPLS